MTSRPPRVRAAALGAAALVLLAACPSGEADNTKAPPSTTTTTTTTTPVEDQVVAAYLGFWDAVFAAGNPPDPDNPALAEFATGFQLERSRAVAAEDHAGGIGTRQGEPPTRHDPRVVRVTEGEAVVVDCWLDTDVLYRIETGERVDDRQVWTRGEFHLVVVEGSWKVERSDVRSLPEGETCDQRA